jgi:hypothetical protein
MEYIICEAHYFEKLRMLYPYLENNGFIAGGVFKDIFLDRSFRDIDFFFRDETYYDKFIMNIPEQKFSKKYENANAIGFEEKSSKIRIDYVRKCFGSPKDILDSFDFSVSKFALYKDDKNVIKVIYHPFFFTDLIAKKLRFDSCSGDPIAQFSRVLKYSFYGFTINKADQKILLKRINALDASLIDNISLNEYYSYI